MKVNNMNYLLSLVLLLGGCTAANTPDEFTIGVEYGEGNSDSSGVYGWNRPVSLNSDSEYKAIHASLTWKITQPEENKLHRIRPEVEPTERTDDGHSH